MLALAIRNGTGYPSSIVSFVAMDIISAGVTPCGVSGAIRKDTWGSFARIPATTSDPVYSPIFLNLRLYFL